MAYTQFQHRRDTAANWASNNPVLAEGEIGVDTTTNTIKVGDGVTSWNNLVVSVAINQVVQALQTVSYNDGGNSTLDHSTHNAFVLTANGTGTTIAHSNVPSSGNRYAFELHLSWATGTITWPATWTKGMNPPSDTGDYVIQGLTINGGTDWTISVIYQ